MGPFVVIRLHEKKHVSIQASLQLSGSRFSFSSSSNLPPIALLRFCAAVVSRQMVILPSKKKHVPG